MEDDASNSEIICNSEIPTTCGTPCKIRQPWKSIYFKEFENFLECLVIPHRIYCIIKETSLSYYSRWTKSRHQYQMQGGPRLFRVFRITLENTKQNRATNIPLKYIYIKLYLQYVQVCMCLHIHASMYMCRIQNK